MSGKAETLGQQGNLPDQTQLRLLQTFSINYLDLLFWCVLLMFAFEPMQRCVIAYSEQFRDVVIRRLGSRMAFRIYCLTSFSYSVVIFFLFQKAVNTQPRIRDLQRNEALVIGYLFTLAGFCIKAHVHLNSPVASIMGGHYFGIDIPGKLATLGVRDHYYHALGTSSVVCYFGLSIIRASAAGILITIVLGVSTIVASQLERYYRVRSTKAKPRQPGCTSAPGSPGDAISKEH